MNSVEEFAYIAAQLEWLEARLRTTAAADSQMETALNALACGRAVISELAEISNGGHPTATAKAA
jgi:hypothetical protein